MCKRDNSHFICYVVISPEAEIVDSPCPAFANSVEAIWSGSALFAIKYANDWLKIRNGHGILIYSAWQRLTGIDTFSELFAIRTSSYSYQAVSAASD